MNVANRIKKTLQVVTSLSVFQSMSSEGVEAFVECTALVELEPQKSVLLGWILVEGGRVAAGARDVSAQDRGDHVFDQYTLITLLPVTKGCHKMVVEGVGLEREQGSGCRQGIKC
ncbi:hypothetical protein E2C01_052888 [Portunus trituberculatus]|uniref:Uncharacterized protein n=1 Tax=Portunus trituberculatus TaxID=210409 RepID=A0A5B7GPE4_PORTR|nr:hypothetical protein [Portunus trituberculatus]